MKILIECCLQLILKRHFIFHNFIYASLKRFGFGKDFVQWAKTLFKNSQSCVMNNGTSTAYFSLERGTRQGNPLSIC